MDEKEYIILKAAIEKLEGKGQSLGSKEVLSILAETTGKTLTEQKTFPILEDLQSRHLIDVQFVHEGLAIADAQIIAVTPEGRKSVYHKMHPIRSFLSRKNILIVVIIGGFVLIGYLNDAFEFAEHFGCQLPVAQRQAKERQFERQKMACGFYSYFSQILFDLKNGKKNSHTERIQTYLASQNYLDPSTHIQIENLSTSLGSKNLVAAKAQATEIVDRLEKIYGCSLSDVQLGVDKKHGAVSADTAINGYAQNEK